MWTGYCTQKMFLSHLHKHKYIIIIMSLSYVNIDLSKDMSFVHNRSTYYFLYFALQHYCVFI